MVKTFGNTQDLVEVDSIQDDTILLKNGSLRQIIMVGGINFSLKSEEEQNTITYSYQNFLNSLDFPIQTIIHSRKINIDDYLSLLEEKMQGEKSELLRSQIGEYAEFIKSFVRDNPIMAKTFLVVVPFFPVQLPDKNAVNKIFPFFGKKDDAEKKMDDEEKEENFRKNLQQLQQRTNQVIEGLQAIELEVKMLNDQELIELFYNFYNPSTVEKGNVPDEPKK
ncbi:MAG TPA: hypothetical protein VMV71_01670 [Candidatus Paceibacterota bacterium]|nr:hypothetical protein [Candidatus Paceibacterota bacterium]